MKHGPLHRHADLFDATGKSTADGVAAEKRCDDIADSMASPATGDMLAVPTWAKPCL